MKLNREQQRTLTRDCGIRANEACDKCGKILGAIRYTRRNEPGECCSRECRDGKVDAQVHVTRKAGRPPLGLSEKARTAHRRAQIREAVQRCRSVIKNRLQPTDNIGIIDAILRSSYTPS